MVSLGYALSSEEHGPRDLVRNAQRAEEAGFDFAMISDHFHPWIGNQGQSPFVWAVLGGIAERTERLRVGTGVTCPTIRIHPAIIAQAAATVAAMMPGRFMLGLGSGEALNEHITGEHWPTPRIRLEMLEEAIEIIQSLWSGDEVSHDGYYYNVEKARLYTRPETPPMMLLAASGPSAARIAARVDGLISTSPDGQLVNQFEKAGGEGKPRFVELTICWAPAKEQARETVIRQWPVSALPGPLHTELATPSLFESVVERMNPDELASAVVYGSDAGVFLEAIERYRQAGFDHVYLHQVGPEQLGFLDFFEREIRPSVR